MGNKLPPVCTVWRGQLTLAKWKSLQYSAGRENSREVGTRTSKELQDRAEMNNIGNYNGTNIFQNDLVRILI